MMILGGGAPASIAIPLPDEAARAATDEEVTLPGTHLLRFVAAGDLGDTRRDVVLVALFAAAGFETPNQLRVPGEDGAFSAGFTKAESVVVGDAPSGARAAVQKARLRVVVSATIRLRPQFRRRTFCDRMITPCSTNDAPTSQAQNSDVGSALRAKRETILVTPSCCSRSARGSQRFQPKLL